VSQRVYIIESFLYLQNNKNYRTFYFKLLPVSPSEWPNNVFPVKINELLEKPCVGKSVMAVAKSHAGI
jgi:hypothetical protein